ncbi:type II toxin-antitoxin system RelE/ParE family toxin [Zunongwangia sp. F260]|uniref:Type II toxin-antitoxin system RelE/ParE family toxin n=1 Tax=Autumnicola lenta TaxID=3075593 RepID=A0ABU3CKR8_9FLAO|nr:type II toxin-antitoxin system RelE/ParE family toxin [Zunongwangia sp. F260]MDT0646828.1 type II toxin-antitoxin system RelE/ParE family toxin [Zunongwangia sp. F260]
MDELSISWTPSAVKQRNQIFDYWNRRNQSLNYSRKLNTLVKDRIQILKKNPEIGVKTNFENTRALSLGHYNILYKIYTSKIIITGLWDNRQDPEKILKFFRENKD